MYHNSEAGFSIVELSVALLVTLLTLSLAVPAFLRVWSMQELIATQQLLVNNLRYAQQIGQTSGTFGAVRMAKYAPRYVTYMGGQELSNTLFAPGVDYVDGYLQMQNANFTYDALGDCQVSGVIRLTDGEREMDITTYMGVGLAAPGG